MDGGQMKRKEGEDRHANGAEAIAAAARWRVNCCAVQASPERAMGCQNEVGGEAQKHTVWPRFSCLRSADFFAKPL
jgi:hypothetical protein